MTLYAIYNNYDHAHDILLDGMLGLRICVWSMVYSTPGTLSLVPSLELLRSSRSTPAESDTDLCALRDANCSCERFCNTYHK